MQLVNVGRGGSLVQDIPSQVEGALQHAQAGARNVPSHTVRMGAGSRLAAISGTPALAVNSLHHQGIGRLGRGLVATAWSEDGLIEALEDPAYGAFFVAVQWHPEELAPECAPSRALFEAFIAACGAGRGG
jgi:putative glutamine amidotransferase